THRVLFTPTARGLCVSRCCTQRRRCRQRPRRHAAGDGYTAVLPALVVCCAHPFCNPLRHLGTLELPHWAAEERASCATCVFARTHRFTGRRAAAHRGRTAR